VCVARVPGRAGKRARPSVAHTPFPQFGRVAKPRWAPRLPAAVSAWTSLASDTRAPRILQGLGPARALGRRSRPPQRMRPLQNAGMPSFQYPGSLHRHSRPCGEDGGEAEPSAPLGLMGARPSRLRGLLFAVNPGEQYPWSGDPGGVRTRASERKGLSSRSRAQIEPTCLRFRLKKGRPPHGSTRAFHQLSLTDSCKQASKQAM